MTTGELSRRAKIPQQTLISWDRSGMLKPKSRPGLRAQPRAMRRYDQDGLIAAFFARALADMGFRGDRLKEATRLMQSGDRQRLERAALFTYRRGPGMMAHVFTSDQGSEGDSRHVRWLRKEGRLVEGPTDLWTIREHLRPQASGLSSIDPALAERIAGEIE